MTISAEDLAGRLVRFLQEGIAPLPPTFGYWNYHAAYGTSFLYAGDGGVVTTAGLGLKILTGSGDWVSVPADLAKKGTALLSAFVHPSPNFLVWESDPAKFGLSKIPDPDDARFPPPNNSVLRRLWNAIRQNRPNYSVPGRLWSVIQQNRRAGPDSLESSQVDSAACDGINPAAYSRATRSDVVLAGKRGLGLA
jgi:hypothetical protein